MGVATLKMIKLGSAQEMAWHMDLGLEGLGPDHRSTQRSNQGTDGLADLTIAGDQLRHVEVAVEELGGGSRMISYSARVTRVDGSVTTPVLHLVETRAGDVFLNEASVSAGPDGAAIQQIELLRRLEDGLEAPAQTGGTGTPAPLAGFVPGTRLATPEGARAVEALCVGDALWTADGGAKRIRHIHVTTHDIAGKDAAIMFHPGAIGREMPGQPLLVAPGHRILCRSDLVGQLFGTGQVLVPAKRFLGMPGVTRGETDQPVRYIHLEIEGHGILDANGALVESGLRGERMRQDLHPALRAALEPLSMAEACRMIPPVPKQKALVDQLLRHRVAICKTRPPSAFSAVA